MNEPLGPKRPVQRAKAPRADISRTVEAAPAAHLAGQAARDSEELQEARAYAEASARFIETNGAWGDAFSTLR